MVLQNVQEQRKWYVQQHAYTETQMARTDVIYIEILSHGRSSSALIVILTEANMLLVKGIVVVRFSESY